MDKRIQLVPLGESQIERAGRSMARAFFDDPLSSYMLPDEAERRQILPGHFSPFIRYGYLFGEVYTTSGDPEGTAVWFCPGESELTPARIEQAGLDRLPEVLGAKAWQRFDTVCNYIESLHPKEVPERHWYLPLLGVDPQRQGQGIGSALLKLVFDRADRDGLPVYLWTAKARNVLFYRRHCFEVVTEDVEPSSAIRFWTCLRAPQPNSNTPK